MEQRLLVGLEAEDVAAVKLLMEMWGLPSQASAVRFALRRAAGEQVTGRAPVDEGSAGKLEKPVETGEDCRSPLDDDGEPEVVRVLDTTESQLRTRSPKAAAVDLLSLPMSERLRRMGR